MITMQATGPFDVKLLPQTASEIAGAAGIGRMSIDKQYHGALDAVSQGEMLAFRNADIGSGGYVAMETVRGVLDGRKGSFMLQHSSTMTRGVPQQSIIVVPDTGTDELAGLAGQLTITITITEGKHFYQFDYTLPSPKR